jgi:hypothetical protein
MDLLALIHVGLGGEPVWSIGWLKISRLASIICDTVMNSIHFSPA